MADPGPQIYTVVNGETFSRWTSVTLNKRMDSVVHGFGLEHLDKSPKAAADAVTINEGDPVTILVDGKLEISGFVDNVQVRETKENGLLFSVSGRSRCKDIIDSAALHTPGFWEEATIMTIAQELLAPFGLTATLGDGGLPPAPVVTERAAIPFRRIAIDPGSSVLDVLRKAANERGLMLTANPDGTLAITVAGTMVTPGGLIAGFNIDSGASRIGDERDRFSEYIVLGQSGGTQSWRGEDARGGTATAVDEQVTRYRPMVMMSDGTDAAGDFQARADWERNVRASQGRRASIPTTSWYDPTGKALWQPNRVIDVQHARMGISGPLLIVGVEMRYDLQSGDKAMLDLMAKEAFDPLQTPKTRQNRKMWASWS